MGTPTLVNTGNLVKKFLASKKFFWKWDDLERRLSKILWKFKLIFYGICNQKQKRPDLITNPLWRCQICLGFFSWNEQIKSLTQCSSQHLLKFRLESHQKPHNEVGSLNLAGHLVGFEPGTFQFICNASTHWSTLSELGLLRWFDLY